MGTKRPAAFYAPLWDRAKAEEIGIAIDIAPDDRVNFINTLYEYRKNSGDPELQEFIVCCPKPDLIYIVRKTVELPT